MLRAFLLALLRAYKRFLSPLLGQRCRFHPSCSSYSMAAIERFGPGLGIIATGARLCRCQPLCEGGLDPVPEHFRDCFWWGRNPGRQPAPGGDDPAC